MQHWVLIVLLLLISFISPKITFAVSIPYLITNPIPSALVQSRGEQFFTTTFTVNYQSGQMVISKNPDGTGNTFVDEFILVRTTRPDGSIGTFTNLYASSDCSQINEKSPAFITDLFQPGQNQVTVTLTDACGGSESSGILYLVNKNGPDPTPIPTPIPTLSPTPIPTPLPTPIPKTPLIFIPGIGGSELKVAEDTNWSQDNGHNGTYTHFYPKDETVWVNTIEAGKTGDDDYFDILKLKTDGQTSEANLNLTGNLFSAIYQPTVDFFTSNGYTLNTDLFTFPYDWRKDISQTSSLLDQKIDQIKQQTGQNKVDIVAHSMGGLVARNYISDPNKSGKVRKLVELGTPHLGSPKFIKNLNYGECLSVFEQLKEPVCFGLSPTAVKDVFRNILSGFELSPSQKYYNFYSGSNNIHPVPFRDERDIDNNNITGDLNYLQTKQLLTNLGHNTLLFTPAETFHNLDNNLTNTNGVSTTVIAGSGQPTLGQIIEKYSFNFGGIKIAKKDEIKINGDETVPLFSASLNDPSKNLSLLGSANVFYTNQTHGGLVSNGPALNLVKNILNNDSSLPSGVSNTPFKLKGKQVSVHSPVNIHAYDSENRHTGPLPDGSYETNIPGSTYDTLDDAKFIFLPEDGHYFIRFEPTDQGTFDFKIRNYNEDTNDKTIFYKDIPAVPNANDYTNLETSDPNPPILNIDDKQYTPYSVLTGNSNYDTTPPEVKVIYNLQNKKIDILGVDETSTTKTNIISPTKAIISDEAGNSTLLNYEFNNSGSKISLRDYPNNSLEVLAAFDKKNRLLSLVQIIYIKGEQLLSSVYLPEKDKTIITKIVKTKPYITTETKNGITLLYLQTNKGLLEVNY